MNETFGGPNGVATPATERRAVRPDASTRTPLSLCFANLFQLSGGILVVATTGSVTTAATTKRLILYLTQPCVSSLAELLDLGSFRRINLTT